jgi:hypothetical protein
MSSFICSPKHFNSCEKAAIEFLAPQNDRYSQFLGSDFYNEYPDFNRANLTPIEFKENISKVFDTLRELQVLCVSLQYKHHYTGKLNEEIQEQKDILMTEKTETVYLNNINLYSALNCLNYQIELEHLTEITPLSQEQKKAYDFLSRLIDALAHRIVRESKDYNKANWSID